MTTIAQNDEDSTTSVLRICTIQPTLRPPEQTPSDAIEHAIDLMQRAQQETNDKDIELFVLPELSPVGYSEDTFAKYLPSAPENQQIYQELDARMAEAAKQLQAHISYGTIGWFPSSNNKDDTSDTDQQEEYTFTIRQNVVDSAGHHVISYDKMLLCDFGDCAETRFFVPSPSLQPASFSIGPFKLGMMICADQRIPTLARHYAVQHEVDVLLQPAAFVRDVSFPTWKSFRETRAVENSVYFVGLNYAGEEYGDTTLVKPWVDDTPEFTPTSLDCNEGWLICDIKRATLDKIRTTFPFYRILKKEANTTTFSG